MEQSLREILAVAGRAFGLAGALTLAMTQDEDCTF
jgi:hypothetical protein